MDWLSFIGENYVLCIVAIVGVLGYLFLLDEEGDLCIYVLKILFHLFEGGVIVYILWNSPLMGAQTFLITRAIGQLQKDKDIS